MNINSKNDTSKTKPDDKNKNKPEAIKWTEADVEKWFNKNNINISIFEDLKPCDGKILHHLYKILTTAPEFFYCALTSKNKISLRDVAVFTFQIEILFKN